MRTLRAHPVRDTFLAFAIAAGATAALAAATGYALRRRSLPLGGAGITEVLMTLALHWWGRLSGPWLATVVVYRGLNFVLPAGPALLARPRIVPRLRSASETRSPPPAERSRAGLTR